MFRNKPLLAGISTVSVAILAAGVAMGAESLSSSRPSPDAPREVATTVSRGLADNFSVLKRPVTSADVVPARLTGGPVASQFGANSHLARRALVTPTGDAVYLMPANGGVCVGTAKLGSFACGAENTAASGDVTGAALCGPNLPKNTIEVVGAAPDVVTSIRVTRADGSTVTVIVSNNAWVYTANRQQPLPTRFTALGDGYTHELVNNVPPDAANGC